MSITEEQRIEFIISKIDIHLEEYKEKPIKEALNLVFTNYLNEDERLNFCNYFYKLYKGYTKYRHLNLMIDYYKTVERLKNKKNPGEDGDGSDHDMDVFAPPDGEISEIDVINQKELIKLKSFGVKVFVVIIIIGIIIYSLALLTLNKEHISILMQIMAMFDS